MKVDHEEAKRIATTYDREMTGDDAVILAAAYRDLRAKTVTFLDAWNNPKSNPHGGLGGAEAALRSCLSSSTDGEPRR